MSTDQTGHFVSGRDMYDGYPDGFEKAMFGLGCFWGAERLFWQTPGVYVTSVGYAGGDQDGPTYKAVCTGVTGHAEVVEIVFDPKVITYDDLLKVFFESHDPTQGNRQGNDIGSQYRSAIFTFSPSQQTSAQDAKTLYGQALAARGLGPVTTEISPAPQYFKAEDYHQQYLAKNPDGYCGIGGVGVSCPLPVSVSEKTA